MTYRGPYSNQPISEGRNRMRRARRDWGNGALVGTVVAMAVVMAILAYGLTRTQINMAVGASTTTSEPTTTGQGSTARTGAPSGIAR
jgi:hypothetical protein